MRFVKLPFGNDRLSRFAIISGVSIGLLAGCASLETIADKAATVTPKSKTEEITLKDNPADPNAQKVFSSEDLSVDTVKAADSEDPRCSIAVSQIGEASEGGPECETPVIKFHAADTSELVETELSVSDSEDQLAPEEKFNALTSDPLAPEGFDPSGELAKIGRGADTDLSSTQALGVVSDVLAQTLPEGADGGAPGAGVPGTVIVDTGQ